MGRAALSLKEVTRCGLKRGCSHKLLTSLMAAFSSRETLEGEAFVSAPRTEAQGARLSAGSCAVEKRRAGGLGLLHQRRERNGRRDANDKQRSRFSPSAYYTPSANRRKFLCSSSTRAQKLGFRLQLHRLFVMPPRSSSSSSRNPAHDEAIYCQKMRVVV